MSNSTKKLDLVVPAHDPEKIHTHTSTLCAKNDKMTFSNFKNNPDRLLQNKYKSLLKINLMKVETGKAAFILF